MRYGLVHEADWTHLNWDWELRECPWCPSPSLCCMAQGSDHSGACLWNLQPCPLAVAVHTRESGVGAGSQGERMDGRHERGGQQREWRPGVKHMWVDNPTMSGRGTTWRSDRRSARVRRKMGRRVGGRSEANTSPGSTDPRTWLAFQDLAQRERSRAILSSSQRATFHSKEKWHL